MSFASVNNNVQLGGNMTKGPASSSNKPIYTKLWFQIVAGLFAVGVIGSIVSPDGGTSSDPIPAQESEQEQASTETFASKGCLEVSKYLLEAIGTGIIDSQITGRGAEFVASEFADVRFVAVEFIPNGLSDAEVAIFATNDDNLADEELNGVIFAADGFAQEFSDWGSPETLGLSSASKGARESEECLALLG
jgi:hypothetical protein